MATKQFTVFTKFAVKNAASGQMQAMAKDADKLATKSASAVKGVKAFGAGVGKFALGVGVAAAGAGLAIGKLAYDSATAAGKIIDLSDAIGISTKRLQEYRYIGTVAGLTTDEMDTALTKLTVNLGKNFEEVDAALYQVGLSAEGLKNTKPDQVLEYIAKGFQQTKDPAKKAAVAVALFGKSNVKMVNALSGGPEMIGKLTDKANELGYVMDDEAVKSADAFGEAIDDRLIPTLTGLRNKIMGNLMPTLTAMTEKLTNGLKPGGGLQGFVKMAESLGGLFGGLSMGFFDKFGEFAQKMAPYIEGIVKSIEPLVKPLLGLLDPLFKIAERVAPLIEGAVKAVAFFLGPIIEGATALLNMLADVGASSASGANSDGNRATGYAPTTEATPGYARGPGGALVPMSPQTAPLTSSTTSTSNVKIDVNAPAGTKITQDKPAPGVTLNTGSAKYKRGPGGRLVPVQ